MGVTCLVVLSTVLSLINPYLISIAIDKYVGQGDLAGLLNLVYVMIALIAANWLASVVQGVMMADVSQKALRDIRKDLFEHLQELSLSFFDKNPSGELMSRLTNDIDAINQALTQSIGQLASSLLTLSGILVVMFALNFWLALATLLVLPVQVVVTVMIGNLTFKRFRELQAQLGILNGYIEETIEGERVVKAFRQEQTQTTKFNIINAQVRDTGVQALSVAFIIQPLITVLSNAGIVVVTGLGSWLALNGLVSIGLIAAFISYARSFAQPLRQAGELYGSIQSALAGAERVFQIIDEKPEVADLSGACPINEIVGHVVFDHVGFSYVPGVPVIKDMSLEAKPGETVALVGPTGAGKTTIINLMARFYDAQQGSIYIDQYEIKQLQKDCLRRELGIVLQDVYLFTGTVMENIRYGRLDATDEDCIEAAKLANADQFIRRLPKGYETLLTERGANLSQGQRQLLSIARAVIADPTVLILDEATSSVDTRTEINIQEALLKLMKNRTSFIIAHRLSTIRKADQLLVINNGTIIERGTHATLLVARGFYYSLYMSQFKGTRMTQLPTQADNGALS